MKICKQIIALSAIGVMVFILAGCGQPEESLDINQLNEIEGQVQEQPGQLNASENRDGANTNGEITEGDQLDSGSMPAQTKINGSSDIDKLLKDLDKPTESETVNQIDDRDLNQF
ncbi:MAG: hypothetical protein WC518_03830 [Patescibacteria group bacterium]